VRAVSCSVGEHGLKHVTSSLFWNLKPQVWKVLCFLHKASNVISLPHRLQILIRFRRGQSWNRTILQKDRVFNHLKITFWKFEINLVPVIVSKYNQFYWIVCKTFASTNAHMFAFFCYFGLQ
jgi:hypothetical protein